MATQPLVVSPLQRASLIRRVGPEMTETLIQNIQQSARPTVPSFLQQESEDIQRLSLGEGEVPGLFTLGARALFQPLSDFRKFVELSQVSEDALVGDVDLSIFRPVEALSVGAASLIEFPVRGIRLGEQKFRDKVEKGLGDAAVISFKGAKITNVDLLTAFTTLSLSAIDTASLVDELATPLNLALIATGGIAGPLGRFAIQAGFSIAASIQLVRDIGEVMEAFESGTPQDRADAVSKAMLSGGFALLLGAGAFKETRVIQVNRSFKRNQSRILEESVFGKTAADILRGDVKAQIAQLQLESAPIAKMYVDLINRVEPGLLRPALKGAAELAGGQGIIVSRTPGFRPRGAGREVPVLRPEPALGRPREIALPEQQGVLLRPGEAIEIPFRTQRARAIDENIRSLTRRQLDAARKGDVGQVRSIQGLIIGLRARAAAFRGPAPPAGQPPPAAPAPPTAPVARGAPSKPGFPEGPGAALETGKPATVGRERKLYKARLNEPTLVDRAVVLQDGQLAVPLGGTRKSGFVFFKDVRQYQEALQLIQGKRGFEGARIEPYMGGQVLTWGESPRPSTLGHAELGRQLGYTEASIMKFLIPKIKKASQSEASVLKAPTEAGAVEPQPVSAAEIAELSKRLGREVAPEEVAGILRRQRAEQSVSEKLQTPQDALKFSRELSNDGFIAKQIRKKGEEGFITASEIFSFPAFRAGVSGVKDLTNFVFRKARVPQPPNMRIIHPPTDIGGFRQLLKGVAPRLFILQDIPAGLRIVFRGLTTSRRVLPKILAERETMLNFVEDRLVPTPALRARLGEMLNAEVLNPAEVTRIKNIPDLDKSYALARDLLSQKLREGKGVFKDASGDLQRAYAVTRDFTLNLGRQLEIHPSQLRNVTLSSFFPHIFKGDIIVTLDMTIKEAIQRGLLSKNDQLSQVGKKVVLGVFDNKTKAAEFISLFRTDVPLTVGRFIDLQADIPVLLTKNRFAASVARINEAFSGKIPSAEIKKLIGQNITTRQAETFFGNLEPRDVNLPGFIPDAIEALRIYSRGATRKIVIDDFIRFAEPEFAKIPVGAPRARGVVRDFIEEVRGIPTQLPGAVTQLVSGITQLQFVRKLGLFRPRAVVTQLGQTTTNTIPVIGVRNVFRGGQFLRTAEGRALVERLNLDFARAPIIGLEGRLGQLGGTQAFTATDLLNRRVAAAGAFQQARFDGIPQKQVRFVEAILDRKITAEKPIDVTTPEGRLIADTYASWVEVRTQFIDIPRVFQSPLGRLFFQFKSFTVNQLAFVSSLRGNEISRAIPAFLLTGGLRAVPFITKVALLGALIRSKPLVGFGIPGLAGVDLSNNVGIGADFLLQFTTIRGLAGPNAQDATVIYDYFLDPTERGSNKSLERLKRTLIPLAITDIQEARTVLEDGGVYDEINRERLKLTLSPKGRIVKAFGMKPIEQSVSEDLNRVRIEETSRFRLEHTDAIDNVVAAVNSGNRVEALRLIRDAGQRGLIFSLDDPREEQVESFNNFLRVIAEERDIKQLPANVRHLLSGPKPLRREQIKRLRESIVGELLRKQAQRRLAEQ